MSLSPDFEIQAISLHLNRRLVLDEVSATFPRSRITVLLGPNGAGKSTLLKVLAGIIPLESGRFLGAAKDQFEHSRLCAWLPPATSLAFDFKVSEVVRMGLYPWDQGRGDTGTEKAVQNSLTELGMSGFADRRMGELSSGERQRVMLARALVGYTPYLLLDEPLANLDLKTSFAVLDILRQRARDGVGVVLSIHDLALASDLTEHFVCLQNGRVLASGHLQKSLQEGLAEWVFGIQATELGGRWFFSAMKT